MAEITDLDVVDANNTTRWPENMPFSGVNDAGRADEGILARWFADTNGSITASGSSNAFTATSNRTISSLTNNLVIAFTANHSITGTSTFNLNGLGAKTVKRFNGNDLAQGDIISGQPIIVFYKSSPDVWFMMTAPAALTDNTFVDVSENASPGDPAANDARLYAKDDGSSTTVVAYRDSAGTESILGGLATQAQMETGTSVTKATAVGRQHFHPAHPKAWGRVASNGSLFGTSYKITSVGTSGGTGTYDVTLTTAMSSANYAVVVSPMDVGGSITTEVTITSASVFRVTTRLSSTTANQNSGFAFLVFGDL